MRCSMAVLASVLVACTDSPTVTTELYPPASIAAVAGQGQTGVAGYLLDDELVVRVTGDDGTPLQFVAVQASVGSPFAAVSTLNNVTDADGLVRFVWRLGLSIGQQELLVSVPANPLTEPLVVSATSGSNPMRSIGGGAEVMCGVDSTGELGCWRPGDDPDHPPRFVPHGATQRFTEMALSPGISRQMAGCAVTTSGRIWCFEVSSDATISSMIELSGVYPTLHGLSVGGSVSPSYCGLAPDGVGWCWGENPVGILGDGTMASRNEPTPIVGPTRFTKLAVGTSHSCGLSTELEVWCWGGNDKAQVGRSAAPIPYPSPVRLATDIAFVDLAVVAPAATCAVERGSGWPYCWGDKTKIGANATTMATIPGDFVPFPLYVPPLDAVVGVGSVDRASVVIRNGVAGSWWGDLSPTRDATISHEPRSLLTAVGLSSLSIPKAAGAICGVPSGADGQLCFRFGSITGYETSSFAGFGMPFR